MVLIIPEPKMYSSGTTFVKYSADGGSFAFYPSGNMAAAYERMGAGFYAYFYADNRSGTTLMAMDPSGEGFFAFPSGKPRLTSRKPGGTFVGDDGAILRQNEVRSAVDLLRMKPEAETARVQCPPESQLGLGVLSPDPRHHPGTGLLVHDIGHIRPGFRP